MVLNKNSKRNRNDESGLKDYYVGLKPEKAANRPPSMNGINKQLP